MFAEYLLPLGYWSCLTKRQAAKPCGQDVRAPRPPEWSHDTGGAGLQTRMSSATGSYRRFWRFEDDASLAGLGALNRAFYRQRRWLATRRSLVRHAGLKTRAPSIRRHQSLPPEGDWRNHADRMSAHPGRPTLKNAIVPGEKGTLQKPWSVHPGRQYQVDFNRVEVQY
jgi:hypothetical protein